MSFVKSVDPIKFGAQKLDEVRVVNRAWRAHGLYIISLVSLASSEEEKFEYISSRGAGLGLVVA